MKLKRRYARSHRDDRPRWIWKLIWLDHRTGREVTRRIGYYCRARDSWRPPSGRLPRLSEKEAQNARSRKLKELADGREGIIIPASQRTQRQWDTYCKRSGQPAGLAFERVLSILDGAVFRRFERVCEVTHRDAAVTLAELLDEWITCQKSDAPASWDDLTEWFRTEGSPNAGHRTWLESRTTFRLFSELCPEFVANWQNLTRDEALVFHNRLAARFKSSATVRKHLSNMRKLWSACRQTWVKGNPWSELRFPKAVANPDAWHYFTEKEVKSLLKKADLIWKGRIRLAWKSGLRPGEIDHLRADDVEWDSGRVSIRRHNATAQVLEWLPKDKDARSMPVDPETMTVLRKLRAKAVPGNPYLFVLERRWKQATARQVAGKWRRDMQLVCGKQKKWQEIVAAAKLKTTDAPPVFYSLRKTCCCDMLTRGVPGHEVRQLMGHADLETTLRWYSKVNKEDAERRIREAQNQAG